MPTLPRNIVLVGDARRRLAELPEASVDCVITSPPYFQLRDYGVKGQLGLEPTVDGWAQNLRTVFRGLTRVLKPTGSAWLNLGDSYSSHRRYGASHKGFLLAPERLVLALARDGWLVRNKVIWAKTNPMPTSISDRLNTTYEVVYFLTRSPHYFFDLDAIREPHKTPWRPRPARRTDASNRAMGPLASDRGGFAKDRPGPGHPLGKNPGDVWSLSTVGFRGPHFGTFPEALVRRPLLATCPVSPGIVLDPFFGTGTVGVVAERHGRDWLGIELNPAYAELARRRLAGSRAIPPATPNPVMRMAA